MKPIMIVVYHAGSSSPLCALLLPLTMLAEGRGRWQSYPWAVVDTPIANRRAIHGGELLAPNSYWCPTRNTLSRGGHLSWDRFFFHMKKLPSWSKIGSWTSGTLVAGNLVNFEIKYTHLTSKLIKLILKTKKYTNYIYLFTNKLLTHAMFDKFFNFDVRLYHLYLSTMEMNFNQNSTQDKILNSLIMYILWSVAQSFA